MTIVASSLIAGSAMADYTGLSFEGVDNGDGTWTARIFADFSAETDQLNAVFGDPDDALLITSTNGFYQNAIGGATSASINPALIPLFPSLALDSWVTIGLEDQTGNNMLNIGIDWSDFESAVIFQQAMVHGLQLLQMHKCLPARTFVSWWVNSHFWEWIAESKVF